VAPVALPNAEGNGVLEACETVALRPGWRNDTGATETVSGTLTSFTGPSGATYTIMDGAAVYGTIPDGGGASCTSDCHSVAVSCASPRPAAHWDANLVETLAPVPQHGHLALHVGESFQDVPRTSPFYRFVETLLHRGVTAGCSAALFCPGSAVTREQMAVFVLRAKEDEDFVPYPCVGGILFPDVSESNPTCPYIQAIARRGIAGGCGGGLFCPGDPVSREQMAVFVLRTLDPALSPPACTTPMFADVPPGSPFCRWIEDLARRGVVTGCGGENYCPGSAVTRDQMAVFLGVSFGLSLYGP
jgi:S-layer homology domain